MNPTSAPAPAPASHPEREVRPNHARPPRRFERGNRPPGGPGGRGARPGDASRRIQRILRRPGIGGPRVERTADYYPEQPAENVVRIVPLGGVEEVGRNMVAVDVNGDILVFDVGFHFKEEDDAPGADYSLPNTAYLEKNKDGVRAVMITHVPLDHKHSSLHL